jgi:glycosyltransferase involved in cell wall biosynthesis
LLRWFGAALCGGDNARDYLVELGMPAETIFLGYNAVDNLYFARRTDDVRIKGARPFLAPGRQLDAAACGRYFLASARFVAKKNLVGLLDAYALYRSRLDDSKSAWPLAILGDGPLRRELEAKRASLGLTDFVHLPGFVQYEGLPAYFGTAGAFVHASTTEQWGLVVNEAMASGLPVVVSNRCGCAATLVVDGENGFTFDPNDTAGLAGLLNTVAHRADRAVFGAASRLRIAAWGPERFAEGLEAAARCAVSRSYHKPGMKDWLVSRLASAVQNSR